MSEGTARAADADFEIPLRRPYGPLLALVATMTPLGLFALAAAPRGRMAIWIQAGAIALLAAAAFYSLVLFCIARHPRFSLVATSAALQLPRGRAPLSTRLRAIAWSEILAIRLNGARSLVVETRGGRFTVPAYWLRNAKQAELAARALDERLRAAERRAGAALAGAK